MKVEINLTASEDDHCQIPPHVYENAVQEFLNHLKKHCEVPQYSDESSLQTSEKKKTASYKWSYRFQTYLNPAPSSSSEACRNYRDSDSGSRLLDTAHELHPDRNLQSNQKA